MFSNDPIWLFFSKYLKLNTRTKSLLFALGIGGFTFFVIPFFSGYLFPRSDGLSSVNDWPGLLITFFTHPAIYLFYCFEQERIFTALMERLANAQNMRDYQVFEEGLRKTLNMKKWIALASLLTFVGYILHVKAVLAHPTLSYYYPNKFILFFINAPTSSLAGYMVCLVAIRYLITIVSLFKYFEIVKPKINVLHPDGCGGLSFIGKFVFDSFILVAIMAIDLSLLIVINLQQINRNPFTEPSFLSLLGFYLLLLPIGFFIPLFSASRTIQNAKQNIQRQIKNELDHHASVLFENENILDSTLLNRVLSLRRLYRFSKISVIPIDRTTVLYFSMLIFVSLLPIVFLVISTIFFGGVR